MNRADILETLKMLYEDKNPPDPSMKTKNRITVAKMTLASLLVTKGVRRLLLLLLTPYPYPDHQSNFEHFISYG
jgi:hypothetical protein